MSQEVETISNGVNEDGTELLSVRTMFAEKSIKELYPHVGSEGMTPEEMVDFLVLEWVTADNELARIKDKERKLRDVVVNLAQAKEKGTTVLTSSDYDVKITRTLEGKYPKIGDVSPAQELYAKYPEVREAFRVSFEERFTAMAEIITDLEMKAESECISAQEQELLTYIKGHRKVTTSSPQLKASKRDNQL